MCCLNVSGSYGIVYLACDKITGKQCAIKVITLKPEHVAVFGNVERIYREVQILRRLKIYHEDIVEFDSVVKFRRLYVTEYVAGGGGGGPKMGGFFELC